MSKRLLGDDGVICLPTSPRGAPLRGTPVDQIEVEYRNQAMRLLCIAGLTGLPQITLPMATTGGLPLGLSLIGDAEFGSGADRARAPHSRQSSAVRLSQPVR